MTELTLVYVAGIAVFFAVYVAAEYSWTVRMEDIFEQFICKENIYVRFMGNGAS